MENPYYPGSYIHLNYPPSTTGPLGSATIYSTAAAFTATQPSANIYSSFNSSLFYSTTATNPTQQQQQQQQPVPPSQPPPPPPQRPPPIHRGGHQPAPNTQPPTQSANSASNSHKYVTRNGSYKCGPDANSYR